MANGYSKGSGSLQGIAREVVLPLSRKVTDPHGATQDPHGPTRTHTGPTWTHTGPSQDLQDPQDRTWQSLDASRKRHQETT